MAEDDIPRSNGSKGKPEKLIVTNNVRKETFNRVLNESTINKNNNTEIKQDKQNDKKSK